VGFRAKSTQQLQLSMSTLMRKNSAMIPYEGPNESSSVKLNKVQQHGTWKISTQHLAQTGEDMLSKGPLLKLDLSPYPH